MKKGQPAKVIYASSESDSDLYYATGFLAPDPFLFVGTKRGATIYVSDLEYSRAKRQAKCKVERMPARNPQKRNGKPVLVHSAVSALRAEKIAEAFVPYRFPAGLAAILESGGIRTVAKKTPLFFEGRAVKSPGEIAMIKKSQDFAQQAVEIAVEMIAKSRPGPGGVLRLDGRPLTSEAVRERISAFLFSNGFDPGLPIVSCGRQSSEPHEKGTGPLVGGNPIIIDVFPKSLASRYWGDVTRTVVKGEPSKKFVSLYEAVRRAQQEALDSIASQESGEEIHNQVRASFRKSGFEDIRTGKGAYGFTHGTGHGVGLDIHEEPRISIGAKELVAGNVVTVEPGLYYPEIGGARIEDLVVVTKKGHENLTYLEKELRIL